MVLNFDELVTGYYFDKKTNIKSEISEITTGSQVGSNTHPEPARDIIQRCDPGGPERWAAERARFHTYGSRDKRSHAPGCIAALPATRRVTIVCATAGCHALVQVEGLKQLSLRV